MGVKPEFTCKQEDLLPLGGFLRASLLRDIADFTAFAFTYNGAYVTSYTSSMNQVSAVVNPRKLMAQQKKITIKLYADTEKLRGTLKTFEGYVKRAANNLDVTPDDFGISAVRTAIKNKNVEGVIDLMKTVTDNSTSNMNALLNVGMTNTFYNGMTALVTTIKNGNQAQNDKISERLLLCSTNMGLLNGFWYLMEDVMDAGKRIYEKNKTKLKDYTMTDLMKRVNNEKKKKDRDLQD